MTTRDEAANPDERIQDERIQDEQIEAFADFVFEGESAAASRLRLQVARIAPHFRVALLTGERGTGKLTIAREMHRLNSPTGGAFFVRDAKAFAAGQERFPKSGTLYLRGCEEVPLPHQESLLLRLKRLGHRMRLVAGSETELRGMVAAGRLRQDFYEWIGTLEIRVAPLRERGDDVAGLAQAMLSQMRGRGELNEDALRELTRHHWTRNFAELWGAVDGVSRVVGKIDAEQLGLAPAEREEPVKLDEIVRRHVADVLQICAGNKLRAAEVLGISRSTLYRMLEAAA